MDEELEPISEKNTRRLSQEQKAPDFPATDGECFCATQTTVLVRKKES